MQNKKYVSRTTEELISVTIIEFHDSPDLWFYKQQYDNMGKFKGFLKDYSMSVNAIKKYITF